MTVYALEGIVPDLPAQGTYWIAPDANVIGRVRLGQDASVWFGSTIRGDNEWISIGQGSNIQEDCVLHTDMGYPMDIGAGVTVGHKAMLHGCTIGENSLIGMGATVLNGARIGRDCLIGACALITSSKVIPDGSMVMGSPGKVVRMLTPEEIDGLGQTAVGYQKNYKRFAAGLQSQ